MQGRVSMAQYTLVLLSFLVQGTGAYASPAGGEKEEQKVETQRILENEAQPTDGLKSNDMDAQQLEQQQRVKENQNEADLKRLNEQVRQQQEVVRQQQEVVRQQQEVVRQRAIKLREQKREVQRAQARKKREVQRAQARKKRDVQRAQARKKRDVQRAQVRKKREEERAQKREERRGEAQQKREERRDEARQRREKRKLAFPNGKPQADATELGGKEVKQRVNN